MGQDSREIRVTRLDQQGTEPDLRGRTPEQCIGMMWQLAMDAWAMRGHRYDESQLSRHVGRVVRRKR
jgi:hypothetical protein